MSFMKNFGISIGIYFLLNVIFLFIYAAVGGVGGATFGAFFGLIGQDIWGFFTAIFTVGGTQADVFTSLIYHTRPNGYPYITNIVGILWVLVPGLVAGILAGKYFSNESSKTAFAGMMLAVFVLSVLPILFVLIPSMGVSTTTAIGQTIIPSDFGSSYVLIILAGIFNGAFFGGWAAMSSNSF